MLYFILDCNLLFQLPSTIFSDSPRTLPWSFGARSTLGPEGLRGSRRSRFRPLERAQLFLLCMVFDDSIDFLLVFNSFVEDFLHFCNTSLVLTDFIGIAPDKLFGLIQQGVPQTRRQPVNMNHHMRINLQVLLHSLSGNCPQPRRLLLRRSFIIF